MMSRQPEAVLRSYWARHWACAVDVLELLAVESAFSHTVVGRHVAEGGREDFWENFWHSTDADDVNAMLRDYVVKLMDSLHSPGELHIRLHPDYISCCHRYYHIR